MHIFRYMVFLPLLWGCARSGNPVQGLWEAKDAQGHLRQLGVCNDGRLQLVYGHSEDTLQCQYTLMRDSIVFFSPFGVQTLLYEAKKNEMSTKLLHGEGQLEQIFERVAKQCPNIPNQRNIPQERTLSSIIPSLNAPTVELRFKSLIMGFAEGDYVLNSSIFPLLGLKPLSSYTPPDERAIHTIASRIIKITRQGQDFIASLSQDQAIEADVPIYDRDSGEPKLIARLKLRVAPNATAKIKTNHKEVEIELNGVKVGTGWLSIPLPALTIVGDKGILMGFKFNLAK